MPLNEHALKPAEHPLERLPHEWADVLEAWGEPSYRGKQVFSWIHKRGVLDPAEMTNLPKSLRARLEEELAVPLAVSKALTATDKTRKLLVRMDDGKDVETVLIPQLKRDPDVEVDDRDDDIRAGMVPGDVVTQCISSQVGCAMGCVFCASGVAGLDRHMTGAEIISQVLIGRHYLYENERLRNIVFMGMGEPLHNYDHVARALVLLTHSEGIGLSTRRVTISSSGLVPQIDRLGREFDGKVQLAISLHATTDESRSKIMPINRKHSLADLVACLKRYPLPRRRRVTLEYTLIKGVNDSPDEADRLAKLMRGIPVKVNLIPMNPIEKSSLRAPTWDGIEKFRQRLLSHAIATFTRKQRGDDIEAACGQLALFGPQGSKKDYMPARKRQLALVEDSVD